MSAPAEEYRWWVNSPWLPLAAPTCDSDVLHVHSMMIHAAVWTWMHVASFPFHISCVFPSVSSCTFQDLETMPVLLLQRPPLGPWSALAELSRQEQFGAFLGTLRRRDGSERRWVLGPGLQILFSRSLFCLSAPTYSMPVASPPGSLLSQPHSQPLPWLRIPKGPGRKRRLTEGRVTDLRETLPWMWISLCLTHLNSWRQKNVLSSLKYLALGCGKKHAGLRSV